MGQEQRVAWGIGDLFEICEGRQKNKFDVIIAWSGNRGNGKSTGAIKLAKRFKCFKPKKHIIYNRREAMHLLEENKYIYILDDEAIRSSYKRNFQDPDQKLLVQMLNMYRSHFNVYSFCIPTFYNLDKDLRSLVTIHIHVIERGLAVVHLPRRDTLYSDDIWDMAYNQKLEQKWAEIRKKHPNFRPPYHKLTTFVGYLRYGALSKQMEELYEQIKESKRKMVFDEQIKKEMGDSKEEKQNVSFYESVTQKLLKNAEEGKIMDRKTFEELIGFLGKTETAAIAGISHVLQNSKSNKTFSDLVEKKARKNTKVKISEEDKIILPKIDFSKIR